STSESQESSLSIQKDYPRWPAGTVILRQADDFLHYDRCIHRSRTHLDARHEPTILSCPRQRKQRPNRRQIHYHSLLAAKPNKNLLLGAMKEDTHSAEKDNEKSNTEIQTGYKVTLWLDLLSATALSVKNEQEIMDILTN
ncbi:hypothetical protein X801_01853, partial [Opisthorchis viverrini]